MVCAVCGASPRKYKCINCLEPYCSLICYKDHQKIRCKTTAAPTKQLPDDESLQEPTLREPFSTEDTVSRIRMEILKNSNKLHNLLYNKHLRNLLTEIDVAPDAWKAMKAAMLEPLFLEFADECLQVIEQPTSREYNQ